MVIAMSDIGENMLVMLRRAKKTQKQVAEYLGVGHSTITYWIDHPEKMNAYKRRAWCEALGQPLEALEDYNKIVRDPKEVRFRRCRGGGMADARDLKSCSIQKYQIPVTSL